MFTGSFVALEDDRQTVFEDADGQSNARGFSADTGARNLYVYDCNR
jgi:hypothetical protein